MILIDSNVLVAAIVVTHVHHDTSLIVANNASRSSMLIAAHSVAEVYSTLTRPVAPFGMPRTAAWAALTNFISAATVAAMNAEQTLDAVRRFSAIGTGPRLYDFLIGATGEAYGARTIVTWNVKDFAPMFPRLAVVTPDDFEALPPPRAR